LARDLLLRQNASFRGVRRHPPGHFYSPLLDLQRLATHPEEFIDSHARLWAGIDLRLPAQLQFIEQLLATGLPFNLPKKSEAGWRYYWDNDYFRYSDGFALAALLQHFRPARIVEVGSGFSTALMLDVAQRLRLDFQLSAIDPFPERLQGLLRVNEAFNVRIIARRVQDLPTSLFEELQQNDFLFVDSSHVAKVGSDVPEIFFRLLPALRPGVIVHFHDIFYPHAYPEKWLREGCAWNEGFILRAFLQFNRTFEVVLFNPFIALHAREKLSAAVPHFLEDTGGSIYLRRAV